MGFLSKIGLTSARDPFPPLDAEAAFQVMQALEEVVGKYPQVQADLRAAKSENALSHIAVTEEVYGELKRHFAARGLAENILETHGCPSLIETGSEYCPYAPPHRDEGKRAIRVGRLIEIVEKWRGTESAHGLN